METASKKHTFWAATPPLSVFMVVALLAVIIIFCVNAYTHL